MRKQGGITRVGMLLSLALLLCLPGCGKKPQTFDDEPEEKGSIFKKNKRTREHYYQSKGEDEADPKPKKGTSTTKKSKLPAGKKYASCDDGYPVTKGGTDTPQGVLFLAYKAILIKDAAESAEAFIEHVDTKFQKEKDVKRYWLASARKYEWKNFLRLVAGLDDPSYVVCREQKEGKDLKLYVGKSPPVGSNPPVTLHKVDGKWKIKRFTAH
jgi:hypothetical protein